MTAGRLHRSPAMTEKSPLPTRSTSRLMSVLFLASDEAVGTVPPQRGPRPLTANVSGSSFHPLPDTRHEEHISAKQPRPHVPSIPHATSTTLHHRCHHRRHHRSLLVARKRLEKACLADHLLPCSTRQSVASMRPNFAPAAFVRGPRNVVAGELPRRHHSLRAVAVLIIHPGASHPLHHSSCLLS
ncbi:hypothetical protein IWZ03DRAFT_26274 [Phyllosticta citriasiana]|uniref:Uncharacterized protein n=1 Tax=Phyllosticta citriasiana TaxID=595635 RepID=A0ABR1L095_9PEZI